MDITSPYEQGWYDPSTGEILFQNHILYHQYNITNIPDPFIQQEGDIYWLELCMDVEDPAATRWGWKSSEDHWNDDAVWRGDDWQELFEPSAPLLDWFEANIEMGSVYGGGSGYAGGEWFYYENTGWWNQWFYDGVFEPERFKVVTIPLNIDPYYPGYIEIALNYSTREWSDQGFDYPPIPPLSPLMEELSIRRVTLLEGDIMDLAGFYELNYVIREYNPEWVSIDIRTDFNAWGYISGEILHDCVQSMDLAFVITGEPGGCPNPGASGNFCTADCFPNNGDGVWNYPADDGDCIVNIQDLATLLANYGMTVGATREQGDVFPIGGDGAVNIQDLASLLSQYGDNCN